MGEVLQLSGDEQVQGQIVLDPLDRIIIDTHRYLTDCQPASLEQWETLLKATHSLGPPTRSWIAPGDIDIEYGWSEQERLRRRVPARRSARGALGSVELVCRGRVSGYTEAQLSAAHSLGRLAAEAAETGDSTAYDRVRDGLDSATRALVICVWNSAAGREFRTPLLQADRPTVPDFVSFREAVRSDPDPDKALSLYEYTRARVEAERQELAAMAAILRGDGQGSAEA